VSLWRRFLNFGFCACFDDLVVIVSSELEWLGEGISGARWMSFAKFWVTANEFASHLCNSEYWASQLVESENVHEFHGPSPVGFPFTVKSLETGVASTQRRFGSRTASAVYGSTKSCCQFPTGI